jgi:hypothetical protein
MERNPVGISGASSRDRSIVSQLNDVMRMGTVG